MTFDFNKTNIGDTDRIIRVVVGVFLLIAAFRGGSWGPAVIGAIVLATAYFRVCPAYKMLNLNTEKKQAPPV